MCLVVWRTCWCNNLLVNCLVVVCLFYWRLVGSCVGVGMDVLGILLACGLVQQLVD